MQNPDKIGGDVSYVDYFWNIVSNELSGDVDSAAYTVYKFSVCPKDVERFPKLQGTKYVFVWRDKAGLLNHIVERKPIEKK